jgi:hypothetical protein
VISKGVGVIPFGIIVVYAAMVGITALIWKAK